MSAISSENLVSVSVGGLEYSRWESVQISSEAQNIVRSISLNVTFDQPAGAKKFLKVFHTGAGVQVHIGSDLVATGYVVKTPVSASATSTSATVNCESRTTDLVDCSVAPAGESISELAKNSDWGGHLPGGTFWPVPDVTAISWRQEKIGTIIAQLIAPYGIRMRIGYDPDGNIKTVLDTLKDYDIPAEKSPYDAIKTLVQEYGLWMFDDEYGDLVIEEKEDNSNTGDLIFSEPGGLQGNILTESADFDGSKLYSAYEVKGQTSGANSKSGKALMTNSGTPDLSAAGDLGRFRYKLAKDTKQMDTAACRKKADGDVKHEKDLFSKVTYTVQGWRIPESGALWKINGKVNVIDSRIFDGIQEMVITRVTQTLDSGGTITELECVPPDGMRQDENQKDDQKKAQPKTKTTWSKKKTADGGIALVDQQGKTVVV